MSFLTSHKQVLPLDSENLPLARDAIVTTPQRHASHLWAGKNLPLPLVIEFHEGDGQGVK